MEKIIQITSGRGPAECCWVVAQVLRLFLEEARAKGLEVFVLHREQGIEGGTLFSATLTIGGKTTDAFLKQWLGTVQWVGQSQFRKFHRRKNWFVGVNELQISTSYHLREEDIRYQATRSGGPGGQHVNKVSTAIRALHQPTGISVEASDSRSQSQNKKKARERLEQLLRAKDMEEKNREVRTNWQNHNELQRGNPVRVFHGSDFKPRPLEKKQKHKRQSEKQRLRKGDWDQ